MIVLRNATTDSPWPVSSNPRAKYNDIAVCGKDSNLHLPLWQLVRASTAAPTFFPPEVINVGPHQFVFVDGGVTMYNNPAFQLFLMATSEPYRLCWPTGEDRMLLISVGTGASANANKNLSPREMNLIYNASNIPSALMAAALHEQDFLCRIFGKCLAGDPLDREVGDVIGQGLPAWQNSSPTHATTPNFPAKGSTRSACRRSIRPMSSKWIPSSTSGRCRKWAGPSLRRKYRRHILRNSPRKRPQVRLQCYAQK